MSVVPLVNTGEAVFLEMKRQSFASLFQAHDIHMHNSLRKINFKIEIDHEVCNCNITPELFVDLRSNSINN